MEYLLHICIIAGIYYILTLSLNLVVGYTGLPSMGHAAFYCVGAYTSALLALRLGMPAWIGLPAGAILAGFLGLIIGLPTLRLKGDFLAIATFGLGVIVYQIALNWVSFTRGPMGLPGIPGYSIFGWEVDALWAYLILVVVLCVFSYLIIRRVVKSPFGRVLRAVRDDETAAKALGKNTVNYKLLAFIIGAFFAGIAGNLYAHYITFIDPSSFTVMESVTILLMVILGGMASLKGSLVGAVVLVFVPEILRFMGLPSSIAAQVRQMSYGLILVGLMLLRPQGLFGKYRFK